MALSSHRKLNVEQLINLAQVYWDDPGKLLEIVEATEARKDPAAQLLFGAVSNRLNRLRSDPVRALGESAPDLAALIAARLGLTKPEAAAGDDSASGIPVVEAERQATARQRRRWPLAAALLLALSGGAAWWLWPRSGDSEASVADREIGIEIQEGGLSPVAEEEKKATASGLPPGRRRPEFPPRPARDPFAREHTDDETETGEAGSMPLPGRAAPAAKATSAEATEPGGAREPAAAAAARGTAASAGGRGAVASSAAATNAAASRPSTAAARDGQAGGGVVIEEAMLQCYLTDARPNACAPTATRGRGSAGGSPGDAPKSGANAPAAVSGATVEARTEDSPPVSRSGGRGQQAGAETSSRRSGASGSGAAAGGSSSSPGSGGGESSGTRSAQRASASASAGGGSKAAQAPKTAPSKSPKSASLQQAPDPECPEAAPEGRVVFIFDGSISMGLPLGVEPAEEDRLDEGVRRRDPEARREYRALLQQSGPKRMGRAQAAFADAAAELPESLELGLVVFQECRDIRKVGVFDGGARGHAIDYIQKLTPRGRTPLAQSLVAAGEMLGDGKSSIVLLTDGIEFCSGDPCAAAEEVKSTRPGTPIHIVDVTGQARTACVAEITGGRSYAPAEADDLARVIHNAFRGAAPHCGAAAASAAEEPRR